MARSLSKAVWMSRRSLCKSVQAFVAAVLIWLVCLLLLYPSYDCEQHRFLATKAPSVTTAQNTSVPTEDTRPYEEYHDNFVNLSSRVTMHFLPGLHLYLHTAFLDDRFQDNMVRVLGMQKKDAPLPDFICRWRSTTGQVLYDIPASRKLVESSWPPESTYFACIFDCNFNNSRPRDIEIVSSDEKYMYTLNVERTVRRAKRKQLALCLKPVTGSFTTPRFVEWFEAQRASGLDDIIFYSTSLLGSTQIVLQYYKDAGVVKNVPFPYLSAILQATDKPTMEGNERYTIYQQVYLVALQDCLYRFYGSYENLLVLDLDEVLLPAPQYHNIGEMLTYLRKNHMGKASGFVFLTAWHFEDFGFANEVYIPQNLYISRLTKATKPVYIQPKCIAFTDRAILVNYHTVVEPPMSNRAVSVDAGGYIHHFRGLCSPRLGDMCDDLRKTSREDLVLPFYRMRIVRNTIAVLKKLYLL